MEKQRFKWPANISENEFVLSEQELHWLLSGYDVLGHQELRYQSML
ncbi:transposase [Thalassotalea sp. PS06]|nr:transposase [Thalassotalea sp. PS06]